MKTPKNRKQERPPRPGGVRYTPIAESTRPAPGAEAPAKPAGKGKGKPAAE